MQFYVMTRTHTVKHCTSYRSQNYCGTPSAYHNIIHEVCSRADTMNTHLVHLCWRHSAHCTATTTTERQTWSSKTDLKKTILLLYGMSHLSHNSKITRCSTVCLPNNMVISWIRRAFNKPTSSQNERYARIDTTDTDLCHDHYRYWIANQ